MTLIRQTLDELARATDDREIILLLRELLTQTHVDEVDYGDWARELANVYVRTRRPLSAARIHEYLINAKAALSLYESHGTARDRGRVLRMGAQYGAAAEQYREAGMWAHAAACAEEAQDVPAALACYEHLERAQGARGADYPRGLAALNAGRVAMQLGQQERAHALLATATRVLEQEADRREQAGDREGAFRCYLCLVEIGKIERSYENLAEGYLNCIRILKAKADRFFTVQYYAEFIALAEELREFHSVAELYREAGEYARRVGFIYGDHFLAEAGRAWLHVAERGQAEGSPTELVENALLAASGCFNRIHDDERVADCYKSLSDLALPDAKKARYAELAKEIRNEASRARTSRKRREGPGTVPEYFRRRLRLPEIWLRDLIDLECGNDIPDAIGRLVGDHRNVWEVQRRKSLLIALAFDDHLAKGGLADQIPGAIIESLGELGHAAAVRPLDAMFDISDPPTQVLVVDRCSGLKQKEAFVPIEKALASREGAVFEAGLVSLRRMTFPQALESLARIYGSHEDERLREACLHSIALIGTDEACEFLLDVIRSNAGAMAKRAQGLLERHARERMLSALERNRRQEPDPALALFIGRLIDHVRAKRGLQSY